MLIRHVPYVDQMPPWRTIWNILSHVAGLEMMPVEQHCFTPSQIPHAYMPVARRVLFFTKSRHRGQTSFMCVLTLLHRLQQASTESRYQYHVPSSFRIASIISSLDGSTTT